MNILGQRVDPRVGQLDASILDSELLTLLKTELWKGFKIFRPEVTDKYENELLLLLKLLLFKVTVWDNSTTYGAKLQNLKLAHSSSSARNHITLRRDQKLIYGILVVGGAYVWNKIDDYVTQNSHDQEGLQHVRELLDKLSLAWSVSSLANFLLFLYSGRYSTLIMRILKIRFIPLSRTIRREVNFEFQNRQLVWNALTEFLLFILPLVNFAKIKRSIGRLISGSSAASKNDGELAFLPEKTCGICYRNQTADSGNNFSTTITNPYQGECGHVYCYVCLRTKLAEDDEGWPCLRCGSAIKAAMPYQDIDSRAIIRLDSEKPLENQVQSTSKEVLEATPTFVPAMGDQTDGSVEVDRDESDESDESDGAGEFIVDDEF